MLNSKRSITRLNSSSLHLYALALCMPRSMCYGETLFF